MMMPGAMPKLTRSARLIELRAEAGIGAQKARRAPIQHVEDHGEHHGGDGMVPVIQPARNGWR